MHSEHRARVLHCTTWVCPEAHSETTRDKSSRGSDNKLKKALAQFSKIKSFSLRDEKAHVRSTRKRPYEEHPSMLNHTPFLGLAIFKKAFQLNFLLNLVTSHLINTESSQCDYIHYMELLTEGHVIYICISTSPLPVS